MEGLRACALGQFPGEGRRPTETHLGIHESRGLEAGARVSPLEGRGTGAPAGPGRPLWALPFTLSKGEAAGGPGGRAMM